MELLEINENDLVEKFILGSGSGGQKINKSSTCVYIKHEPTGIELKCQESRLRESNRYLARKRLCEKIEFTLHNEQSKKQEAIDKIRRQKKRRSARAKQKMLSEKAHQGRLKLTRKKPELDN